MSRHWLSRALSRPGTSNGAPHPDDHPADIIRSPTYRTNVTEPPLYVDTDIVYVTQATPSRVRTWRESMARTHSSSSPDHHTSSDGPPDRPGSDDNRPDSPSTAGTSHEAIPPPVPHYGEFSPTCLPLS
jgi:hypothetical protein